MGRRATWSAPTASEVPRDHASKVPVTTRLRTGPLPHAALSTENMAHGGQYRRGPTHSDAACGLSCLTQRPLTESEAHGGNTAEALATTTLQRNRGSLWLPVGAQWRTHKEA